MPKFAASISRKIDTEVFSTNSYSTTTFEGLFDATNVQDSTGTLNIAHLLDAVSKLDKRQSAGAKFYFHRIILYGTILALTDTAGNAQFPPGLTNMGENLWKIPTVTVEDLPYALNQNAIVGLYANMRQAYVIGQRKGVGSFFFNPYSLDISEQTRITLGTRWDGRVGFGQSCVQLKY